MLDELAALDQEIRSCKHCGPILAQYPENPPGSTRGVVPRPILSPAIEAPIMLIGQAPGLTEYREGQPFAGSAGQEIRGLFVRCGLRHMEFDGTVYQTSAVKCFPGRKLNGERWEDRPPCATMHKLCGDFLSRQLDLVRPAVIVALGSVAMSSLDRLRRMTRRSLGEVVGTSEKWDDRTIVYLAHTSGTSRFLNSAANRDKQKCGMELLKTEIAALRAAGRLQTPAVMSS